MKKPKKPMKKMQRGGMTAGAGTGMGRMQKAGMSGTGMGRGMIRYKGGGKVKSKRGYGAARKGC
jgi:hypothetical protein